MRTERGALRILAEGKLEDCHAGEMKALANGLDFRGDDSEVLRDDRQLAEFALQHSEYFGAWPFHPTTVDRGGLISRNFPMRLESAEMIDAYGII